MENSLPQSTEELKAFLQGLDRFIMDKALEWAKKAYKAILEQVDEVIAKHRGRGLSIQHRRGAWYQTYLGPVRVNRRQHTISFCQWPRHLVYCLSHRWEDPQPLSPWLPI